MGYSILDVSKELGVNDKILIKELSKNNFGELIFNKDNEIFIKKEAMSTILEYIDKGIIKIDEINTNKNREIDNLKAEILLLKNDKFSLELELLRKDKTIKILNEKIEKLESKIFDENLNSNNKINFVTRVEKNKKRRWF